MTEEELTQRLMDSDFGKTKGFPLLYKSTVTGNTFNYKEYSNIGEVKHGFKPLPFDEYPYRIIYSND